MNIGFVVYGDINNRSGGFRYDRQLIAALREFGDNVDIIELPWRSYLRGLFNNLSPRLRRQLDKSYDILLQDELAHPSLVVMNRLLSTPIVSIVHLLRATEPGRHTQLYSTFERWYLESVDGVICNSTATRDLVTELGVDSKPVVVAPPAGSKFDITADDVDFSHRRREQPVQILFVGHISRKKGLDTLIDGIANAEIDAELTVVGRLTDDNYMSEIRQQILNNGLNEQVTFTGELYGDELKSEYQKTNIFAVPARYEAFGIVYAEAMSFGHPVIASSAGGASDIVTHGKTGFLVDPNDPSGVADAITTLGEDPERLAQMGQAARRQYESHPDWAETTQRVRALLRDVADESD